MLFNYLYYWCILSFFTSLENFFLFLVLCSILHLLETKLKYSCKFISKKNHQLNFIFLIFPMKIGKYTNVTGVNCSLVFTLEWVVKSVTPLLKLNSNNEVVLWFIRWPTRLTFSSGISLGYSMYVTILNLKRSEISFCWMCLK